MKRTEIYKSDDPRSGSPTTRSNIFHELKRVYRGWISITPVRPVKSGGILTADLEAERIFTVKDPGTPNQRVEEIFGGSTLANNAQKIMNRAEESANVTTTAITMVARK
jgi:hypothetical protein